MSNQPIVSLLVPDQIKLIFYVTDAQLGHLKLRQKVQFITDSGGVKQAATIDFISPMAQYTPPVIYSQSSRADLVYKIEARIISSSHIWHPGQPVSVLIGSF